MAKIPGTNVASTIAPFTTDDQFPTHDAIYGKGGQREVATIAERDAIPSARLTEGCTCYVAATEKTYRWKSNTWVDDTPEIVSDASDISYTPSGSSTPTNVAGALDSLNESVSGLESSVEDNADDIADLQEGAVAVDVNTTTKVFAIKNAKGQDVGTITVSETTGLPATLTLEKAGTNGQSITVSLPTLAYNSQTQMLEYVDATGNHVPTVKLSNLTIKYVGSTDPSTGDWALGDLILVGSNSSYELKVYDGNSTWQSLGSINDVSLQAEQISFTSNSGLESTNVRDAIDEVNEKVESNTNNITKITNEVSSFVDIAYDVTTVADLGEQETKGYWLLEAQPTPTIYSVNNYKAFKTPVDAFDAIDCNLMYVTSSSSNSSRLLFKFVDDELNTLKEYAVPEETEHSTFVRMEGIEVPKNAKYILHSCASSGEPMVVGYSVDGYSLNTNSILSGSITKNKLEEDAQKVFDIATTVKEETQIEPDNVVEGFYGYDGKTVSPGSDYRGCDYYIEGKDTVYISSVDTFASGTIKYVLLDDDKNPVTIERDSVGQYTNLEIEIPEGISYVRFNYRNYRGPSTVKVYGDSDVAYIKNVNIKNGSITKEKLAEGILPESILKTITIENSDKIGIIGDSYTESSFAIANKSYIAKMSLFSDYEFVNFGKSGDIYVGRIYDVRIGSALYGTVPYDGYKTKYSMLCCYTNDIKYMKFNDYIRCVQSAIDFFKGIGSEPIVCTEYQIGSDDARFSKMSVLGETAKNNDCLYWNIVPYVDIVRYSRYEPFWGGTHAGTRTNAIESDPYLYHLSKLERPMQSIKLFRPRTAVSSLDDLMFGNNIERAEKYKEIIVGDRCLTNVSDADNCTSASAVVEQSEYGKLIQNQNVSFSNYALASIVLPAVSKDITKLNLEFTSNVNPTVYVQRTKQAPYPTPTKLANFYITYNTEPLAGAVYMCNEDNETYTVVEVMTDDFGNIHLLASGDIAISATTGTLTKVSGTGDEILTYTYREVGYSSQVIANDTIGHWVEVSENTDGVYDISSIKDDVIDVDKVHFLIEYNGTFNISDIKVNYSANTSKIVHRMPIWEFKSNYYNTNPELLPSSTFGTAGTLNTNWNITPVTSYEQQQGKNTNPKGITSIYKVTDINHLSAIVPIAGDTNHKATLEIWCRYFPQVGSLTENSYDYNKVYVSLYDNYQILEDIVGTYWKVIQFDIQLGGVATPIKIYSDSKGIEIAYVSLKVKE